MRLTRIEIEGFRGFAKRAVLDLDADAIILVGTNGKGKTTVFDAILWVLAGYVPRLGSSDKELLSLYSQSGEIRVALDVSDNGRTIGLVRRFDGEKQHLTVNVDDSQFQGARATAYLMENFWPSAMQTTDTTGTIAAALTRCIYLQQDLVRQFIEADSAKERFSTVSELIGAGRVGELQADLERSRKAWSQITNRERKEMQDEEIAVLALESRVAELSATPDLDESELSNSWSNWWDKAKKLAPSVPSIVSVSSNEASSQLDIAIKHLSSMRRSLERRIFEFSELLDQWRSAPTKPTVGAADLKVTLDDAVAATEARREELRAAEQGAATQRQLLVSRREAKKELRALAELALRHLEDKCPVCTQEYDPDVTRSHLEELIASAEYEGGLDISRDSVREKAESLKKSESLVAEYSANHSNILREERRYREWSEALASMVQILVSNVPNDTNIEMLCNDKIKELAATNSEIRKTIESGEALSVTVARAGELARNSEYKKKLEETHIQIDRTNRRLKERDETSRLVSRLIEALRTASHEVVQEQLRQIEPLVQRAYSRINPHPTLRAVSFLTSMVRGHGQLSAKVVDPSEDISTSNPHFVLSSSQLNALAVSVFLGLNLGLRYTPLDIVLLDDPLQSLDDINLLGLIDLLRRIKDRRQLILSTHDESFGRLLARKLRPSNPDQATKLVHFESWSREGPQLVQSESKPDAAKLRIVA